MTTPYENLANAIILSAVDDYRKTLRRCVQYPHKQAYISEKQSLEHFFRSNWFFVLTSLDPEILIAELIQEVA